MKPAGSLKPARVTALTPGVLTAIAVTMLAWASAFVVIRGVGTSFGGGSLALARLLVGSVVLGLILLASRRQWVRPTGREWALIAGFGVAWFGAYNIALNIAEQTLDAGTTAMLINIAPVFLALGAGLILREGIPPWLAIGGGVALVGVIVIGLASRPSGSDMGIGPRAGVIWCLVAALTYTVGVLMQKPALKRLPAAQVTFLGCVIGAVACLPFAPELVRDLASAPLHAIAAAVYLGVVPTAIAFSTWAYALSRIPAGQLGVSTYVVPPLAILLALLVFGEVPPMMAVFGGAVCLVGVALSRRQSR